MQISATNQRRAAKPVRPSMTAAIALITVVQATGVVQAGADDGTSQLPF